MARIVLIVDDAEQCAETLEVALFGLPGVDVLAAGSAEAALRVMKERSISAFITDLHLPRMSGFDLIRLRHLLPHAGEGSNSLKLNMACLPENYQCLFTIFLQKLE